jgi:hypothetical protein
MRHMQMYKRLNNRIYFVTLFTTLVTLFEILNELTFTQLLNDAMETKIMLMMLASVVK